MKTLIKVDRNGSKHYEGYTTCPKCGGSGLIVHHMENGLPSYQWTDGGVCWKCEGTGKVFSKWIERTPEYQAKLDARRKAKEEAKKAEHDAKIDQIRMEWLTNNGWTADGFTFLFLGDTYQIKDQIKDLGGKYNHHLGWHIDHMVEGFDLLKVSKDDVLNPTYYGYMENTDVKVDQMKQKEWNRLHPSTSEYQGELHDRLKDLKLTLVFQTRFENKYKKNFYDPSFKWLYSFVDESGNIYTWTAGGPLDIQSGQTVILDGTVRDHKTYKGQKQTVLTRCKVKGVA